MCIKSNDNISDQELIKKLVCGEYDYFKIFIKRFELLVFETVSRHVPESVVDDIAQEVFLKVFKSLKTLAHHDKIKGWLKKICINCSCDYWRREYKKKEATLSSFDEGDDSLLEYLDSRTAVDEYEKDTFHRELRMVLDMAMQVLSPKDRILIELVYFDGVSVSEAAEMMEMTTAGAKIRTFRAKKKLHEALEKLGVKDSYYD